MTSPKQHLQTVHAEAQQCLESNIAACENSGGFITTVSCSAQQIQSVYVQAFICILEVPT